MQFRGHEKTEAAGLALKAEQVKREDIFCRLYLVSERNEFVYAEKNKREGGLTFWG